MDKLTRRSFLKFLGLGAATTGASASTAQLAHGIVQTDISTETVSVHIEGLPKAFEGYKIGFLTDIHLGIWITEDSIREALDLLVRQQVDILLLGGDFILVNDSSVLEQLGLIHNARYAAIEKPIATAMIYESIAGIFKDYQNFPDGIVAVVGNHDRWNLFPEFLKSFNRCPSVRLLINSETVVTRGNEELRFFGSDDYLTGIPTRPPPAPLADGHSKRILLTHNPDYVTATILEEPPSYSLALCGHTHGGQIVLPLLGPIAAQVQDARFISGLSVVNGVHVYTSRGLGYVGLPVRLRCPPEVTVVTLVGA